MTIDTDHGVNVQSTDLVLHPASGEILNLSEATTVELASNIERLADLEGRLRDFKRAIADEVARRMDRINARTDVEGDFELKVNAPTTELYDADALRRALGELVDGDVIDEALLNAVVGWERPAPPPPRLVVSKRELGKLKRHTDPRVLAAIAGARTVIAQTRTLSVTRRAGA